MSSLQQLGTDIATLMFIAMLITGITWWVDRAMFAKRRDERAKELARAGKHEEATQARREPVLVEYARAFFPVILVVFVIRSFLVEPFRIPSGSMMPNLLNGDFILVNKFSYGVRLPIVNMKIIDTNEPKRGDVVVFRYPPDPSQNYIKRLVGLPGDRVEYKKGVLSINGKPMEQSDKRIYYPPRSADVQGPQFVSTENLDGVQHNILGSAHGPGGYGSEQFTYRENCNYNEADVVCTVPPGHYFMMGDNRDNSRDGRVWGFVPDQNLVGRAFLVWFSLDMVSTDKWFWQRVVWDRIGGSIH